MSEMINQFKNKLIFENCFHVTYSTKKIKVGLHFTNKTEEVTIGFMRDRTFDEEFFLVVESKVFNPKTGMKDKKLIAVDDIDEIAHLDGY